MTDETSELHADSRDGASRPRTRVLAGIGLVLVLCLAGIGWGQWWLHGERAADHREAEVLSAAEHGTSLVLSYDYRRLAAGSRDTEVLLTGDALRQYRDVQAPLVKAAPGLKAVVEADVKTATVLSAADDSARVLLFVDQTSTSKKLAQPQLDQSRIVVSLTRKGGAWLIESISAV